MLGHRLIGIPRGWRTRSARPHPHTQPRDRLRNERGFTLVELSVAIVLAGILGSAVLSVVISSSKNFTTTSQRNMATGELSVAFDSITQTLQSSYRDAGINSVLLPNAAWINTANNPNGQNAANSGVEATFYATTKSHGLAIIHWYVQGKSLREEIIPCAARCGRTVNLWDVNPVNNRVLLEGLIVPTAGQRPIFTWFGAASTEPLNYSDNNSALWNPEAAVAVHVSLSAALGTDNNKPSTVENLIVLPGNLELFGVRASWSATPNVTGTLPTSASAGPSSSTPSSTSPPSTTTIVTTTVPTTTTSTPPTSAPPTTTGPPVTTTTTFVGPPGGFV